MALYAIVEKTNFAIPFSVQAANTCEHSYFLHTPCFLALHYHPLAELMYLNEVPGNCARKKT